MVLALALILAAPVALGVTAQSPARLPALHPVDQAFYQRLCFSVKDSFDGTRGGFVTRAGYPSESALDLAFRVGRREGREDWIPRALFTASWMLALEDSVSGGFYARKDNSATEAMFDRFTDVNARRLENMIDAWEATGDTRYRETAERAVAFMDRSVVDGRGGFIANPVGDQDLIPDVNGMAIRAWLRWWIVTQDANHREFALRSLDRVWEVCWRESLGLVRLNAFGDIASWPRLLDQAEMGRAFTLSAHLTGRDVDVARARKIADLLLARFEDRRHGGFRGQVASRNGVVKNTPRPGNENARAALFLCELAHVTGEARYFEAARRAWRTFERDQDRASLGAADWALALDAAFAPVFPAPPGEPTRSDEPESPRKPVEMKRLPAPESRVGVRSR